MTTDATNETAGTTTCSALNHDRREDTNPAMASDSLPAMGSMPPPDLSLLFDVIESENRQGLPVSSEQKARISAKINEMLTYEPMVGIFGKTGVGKSSLCNALFGRDVCPISHIDACTRHPQEILLKLGQKGITLLDLPGVGESAQRDEEYRRLYARLMPEIDVVVWLFKGDERAYGADEEFYKSVIKPEIERGKPFLIVINQIDKISPEDGWSRKRRCPEGAQAENIEAKRHAVARLLGQPLSRVIAVSTKYRYGLGKLVEAMVDELPNDRKLAILPPIKPENVTSQARVAATRGFLAAVEDTVKRVAGIIVNVAKAVAVILRAWAWWKSRKK